MNSSNNDMLIMEPVKVAVAFNPYLNGTSADMRFLDVIGAEATNSSMIFEVVSPTSDIVGEHQDSNAIEDWTKDYQPLLRQSPAFEELQKQSA